MSPRQQTAAAEGRRSDDRTADSRTGGRKKKTRTAVRVRAGHGAAGGPPLPAIPTRSRHARMLFIERETGAPLAEPFSRAISGKRNLQRMRGEFLGTPPPLSLVKAQPHPPTLLFMVLAFRENHVSTATAQQSVMHFQQRSCSNSNSNSRLGIGQPASSE